MEQMRKDMEFQRLQTDIELGWLRAQQEADGINRQRERMDRELFGPRFPFESR
jgi:hypothetical protein